MIEMHRFRLREEVTACCGVMGPSSRVCLTKKVISYERGLPRLCSLSAARTPAQRTCFASQSRPNRYRSYARAPDDLWVLWLRVSDQHTTSCLRPPQQS